MRIGVCALAALSGAAAALADSLVLPTTANFSGGAGSYNIVFNAQPHSYLVVYGSAELNGRLPVGATITGLAWRNASWISHATWPAAQASFEDFDVYLGVATNPPGQLNSANILSNVEQMQMVRSGPLTLPAGYLIGGSVSPNPNPFGEPVQLHVPYVYQGGPLAIMIRHTGNNAGSTHLDWVSSFYGAVGGQGLGIASYTQNSNWSTQGHSGALALRITYTLQAEPCYANCDGSLFEPELTLSDFSCFLQRFAAGDMWANCDQSTGLPVLNVGDFTCFMQKFTAGCR